MGKVSQMKRETQKAGALSTLLGALVFAEPALGRLCELKLSAKSAYRLAKMARLVTTETKHYHEMRDKHIKELGVEGEKGQISVPVEIDGRPNANFETFVARMTELSQVAVELDLKPLTLEELGECSVAAGDLLALGVLLSDEEAS